MEKTAVHQFDGKDFSMWKFSASVTLKGLELWDYVSGDKAKPAADDEGLPNWVKANNKAMMYLTQWLNKYQLALIVNCDTAKDIWTRLCDIHEQKTGANIHSAQVEWYEYKKDPKHDMATHIATIENMARRLKDLGEERKDSDIISKIFVSLPDSFNALRTAWDSAPASDQTLVKLTARVLKEEQMQMQEKKRRGAGEEETERTEALVAQGRRGSGHRKTGKKFTGACRFCNLKGHKEINCWEKHPEKRPAGRRPAAADANTSERKESVALTACKVSIGCKEWIADSGASDHMCSEIRLFSHLDHINDGDYSIRIANSDIMLCKGIGTIDIQTKVGNQWKEVSMKNVLYVPELGRNLFSLSAVTKAGASVVLTTDTCKIYKEKKIVAEGEKVGELFMMRFRVPHPEAYVSERKQPSAYFRLWHERLGHVCAATVKKAISGMSSLTIKQKKEAHSFSEEMLDIVCPGCAFGKMHRDPFPSSTNPKETVPGSLIHVDTGGEMFPESVGKSKYYVLFKDEATNYMVIYFLGKKSEVKTAVQQFLIDWSSLSSFPVKRIRSDFGTEFVNQEVLLLLLDKGIKHEKSIPHCPEMNGVIERSNRTIVESARSMLHGVKLPQHLWAEACNTAVYLQNRLPHTQLGDKSPHEVLTGKKVDLSGIRIFGSEMYVHVPDNMRKKWEPKSKKMILVGYLTDVHGYRVYNPSTGKVSIVRHAKVNERMSTQIHSLNGGENRGITSETGAEAKVGQEQQPGKAASSASVKHVFLLLVHPACLFQQHRKQQDKTTASKTMANKCTRSSKFRMTLMMTRSLCHEHRLPCR